jgi:hypothetical protein
MTSMAQKIDFRRPFNDLRQYLPKALRNPVNQGLLDNLFNRHLTRDEAVPLYGYIGRRPGDSEDSTPAIPQLTPERDINAVIPVLNFRQGAETVAFTSQDLLNRAKVLGMDTDDLSWVYAQGNNFRPPIDFDKFTNFFNYYWVAKALDSEPTMPWNTELLPEYCVIAAPVDADPDKRNVVTASGSGQSYQLTGSGFLDQTFTVTFTTPTSFTVSLSAALLGPLGLYLPSTVPADYAGAVSPTSATSTTLTFTIPPLPSIPQASPVDVTNTFRFVVTGPAGTFTLLSFNISHEPTFDSGSTHNGYTSFSAGDALVVATQYLSTNYTLTFSGSVGLKPKTDSVSVLMTYQAIGGYQVSKGDRVLIKNQVSTTQNGIYVVSEQAWARTSDYDATTWATGARTFVRFGDSASTLWTSGPSVLDWSQVSGVTVSNTNDWQEGNFWVSGDKLVEMGLERGDVIQASRPIIELSSALQLNAFVDGAVPSDTGAAFRQVKTEFGQLPLFDLYRYDGTHSGLVSSIFFYVEDLTADLDLVLQRRVKRSTNDSADFVFNHGCADQEGQLLFFKSHGALKTVWHAGYLGPTAVDTELIGTGDGSLSVVVPGANTQQQVWQLAATTATTFEVAGSKMPTITPPFDVATVGVPYDNGDIAFTITAGATPFAAGDTFIIRIGNLERPRYVFRASDDSIQDLFGGRSADTQGIGAYQVPRTFIHNPYNESRAELAEGSLYTHFRSVLGAKVGSLPLNYAFGGNIKLWSEQHTLLASLLMQQDLTITSMVDAAQRQYETGLNAIADLFKTQVLQYFSSTEVVDSDGTTAQTVNVNELLDHLLSLRALDNDVRTVLYDTTAGVIGFPATLPQLGLSPLVAPTQVFDLVLGTSVLQHHDGHLSALARDTLDFRDSIFSTNELITRSDGSSTPAVGSFTLSPPSNPYKGQLWLRPTGEAVSEMLAFDVLYDTFSTPSVGPAGSRWYQRGTATLFESDGISWLPQPSSLVAWRVINLADTLNELMLVIERRLFNAINPDQRRYDFAPVLSQPEFKNELARELFNFAALNGLDPLGTNYSAADAFSWNYSSALLSNFPALSTSAVPARWYDALSSHFSAVPGSMATQRPDLEPWRLFGFITYAAWWASLAPATQLSYTPAFTQTDSTFINAGFVRAVKTVVGITPLVGLQVIDGVALNAGDRVLLTSETSPANNGIWVVSAGGWARAPEALVFKTFVTVTEGQTRAGTVWALTATVITINSDPVLFGQVRRWTDALWADLAIVRPALRTSVSPFSDALLPPYVSPSQATSPFALTTVIPSGVALPFQFGEGSPVEEVWERSVDYGYALVKALGRYDPLALLGFAWGFNWVEVDGILYDGFDINMPGHKRFRLHGEPVSSIDRTGAFTLVSVTNANATDITLTYDAYDTLRRQSFSVRDTATGVLLGTVTEGTTFPSVVFGSITLSSLRVEDNGRPFRIGDAFRVTALPGGLNVTITPALATAYRYLGLGQTFTTALREVAVSTTNSYAMAAFRQWDINMGYRAGGLVATDDLGVFTEMDTLSSASYRLLFKRNEVAKDMWLQALRVTVLQYGTFAEQRLGAGIYRGDIETKPYGDAADWVFRIEGYNPRYSSLTYSTVSPILSGVSFPSTAVVGQRFFRHDTGTYYEFDGSSWNAISSSELVTFKALDQSATSLTWFQPTTVTGTSSTFLPLTITGLQNLITFLFGYAHHAEMQGWRFNSDNEFNIDAETGRHRNFQLEVEKTVDRVYRGLFIGQGHVINPFMDRVWVQQDTGMLAQFKDSALFDVTGNPGIYDVLGARFKATDIIPLRGNLLSAISTRAPMYSVHAQLDEYEHLFIFSNFVEASTQNGLLYDAFSGSRTVTYKFKGRMQGSGTFRPEFGGHYLVGNEARVNLQNSTDAIENAYNPNTAFENETISKHSLALLGFSPKDYFSSLDISDKTQFNFWRGLIHSKGTNMSVGAFLNSNRYRDAQIDEYWAYKIAEYGDARQLTYPELRIGVVDALQQFTQLQFDAPVGQELTNFIQVSRLDEARWFSIDDLDQDAYFKAEQIGTFTKPVVANEVVTLPFVADKLVFSGPVVKVNGNTLKTTGAGTVVVAGFGPSPSRYNPVKLLNYVDDEVVEEIPHWHPAAGQQTPTAIEAVNIISSINPARFNYSTLVQNNNSFDPLRPWGERELGRVWLDTRNLDWVPYYDPTIFPNRAERLSRWGALADYATIDVYEWVRSNVPPAEYGALAAVEAVDADITDNEKASGQPALQETYVRDRQWSIRPVAWSETGTVFGGHPSFSSSFGTTLRTSGNLYTLEFGTFASLGVAAGQRIGGWDPLSVPPKPLFEAAVTDVFTKVYLDGTSTGTAITRSTAATATTVASVTAITMATHTDQNGLLIFTGATSSGVPRLDPDSIVVGYDFTISLTCTDFDSGFSETVVVDTAFNTSNALPAVAYALGQTFIFTFPTLGVRVTTSVTAAATKPADAIKNSVVAALGAAVSSRDAVFVTEVVTNSTGYTTFSNDANLTVNPEGFGWKAWTVPTQEQLYADGRQPNSIWKPYAGDFVPFFPSETQLAAAVAYVAAPLTMNDGTAIARYSTSWGDWEVLSDVVYATTATATGPIVQLHTEAIDGDRATVYVNGIAQLKAAYTIDASALTVLSVTAGSKVRIIIRKFNPSDEQLAFNPDTADDLTFQQHYKQDYEYVTLPQRDSDGSFGAPLYYFWVKGRSVVARGKKLSVQAVAQQLRDGPPSYLTFQPRSGLLPAESEMLGSGAASDPYRYDAITISGLSYVVTKDNTFKLRFTRNFVLRDEPEELNLKNVHTEWGLIRPAQKVRVPEQLWNKLVDSMAGENAAGDALPALRRVLYDERNGSNTRFGFGPEQTLAPAGLLRSSVEYTVLNTRLIDTSGPSPVSDFITFLDFNQSDDWFSTAATTRQTMTAIWTNAKVSQINEIFFAALEDVLASNLELSDIFKTSRLSAYSIKVVSPVVSVPTYE